MRKYFFIIFVFILFFSGCREDFSNLDIYNKVTGEVAYEVTLEPIANAKISTNPVTELRITDEFGKFILDSLTSSIYSIKVVADGYQSKLTSFNIEDLDNNKILILMEKDSIVLSPPLSPFNPVPANNSEQQELEIKLLWSSSDDNDSINYEVLFYKPESIIPEVILSQSLDTNVLVSNLAFNTTYFWQVKATDSDGLITLGPTWNFKTQEFPSDTYRYTFVRNINSFDQIFVGAENGASAQITNFQKNQWRPTFSPQRNEIAFLSLVGGEVHIHLMNRNGDNVRQITKSRPFRTKDILDTPFSWAEGGERIIYMDLDRIFSITRNGTGLIEYEFQSNGNIISSLDYSSFEGGKIIVTTEVPSGNESSLFLYDIGNNEQFEILDSLDGQFTHAQFSPSGRQIIFTYNESSKFSTTGIPLDKKMYYYDFEDKELIDISDQKEGGTADSNPRFSNNGARVAFNNGPSDGIGQINSYTVNLNQAISNETAQRDTLFVNSNMIDWE